MDRRLPLLPRHLPLGPARRHHCHRHLQSLQTQRRRRRQRRVEALPERQHRHVDPDHAAAAAAPAPTPHVELVAPPPAPPLLDDRPASLSLVLRHQEKKTALHALLVREATRTRETEVRPRCQST